MTYTDNPRIPDELIIKIGNSRNNTYYKVPELNNKVIHANRLSTELKPIGMTGQTWYDRHALGIEDPADRPKCPYCGKIRAWLRTYAGYRPTCGSKECKSKEYTRVQCESRKVNPDRWEKQRNTMNKALSRLEAEWEEWGKDSGIHRFEFMSKFWKRWRAENDRITVAEFKATRHENMLERKRIKEENKRRYEEDMSNYIEEHGRKFPYGGIKSKTYSEFENSIISFDSLWERSYFMKMSKSPFVKSIIRKIGKIRYFDTIANEYKLYMPDFLIEYTDGTKELIEIKPSRLVNDTNILDKRAGGEEWCRKNGAFYVTLTEHDLYAMGIVDEYGKAIDLG